MASLRIIRVCRNHREYVLTCVALEVQGWSHLNLIAGVLGGLLAGVALAVYVGLKYYHLGSSRSLQLSVSNEVSVTNGGDNSDGAGHRRLRGRGVLEGRRARDYGPGFL